MSGYSEKLVEQYPNKHYLTPALIKHLEIKDWERLKQRTWHNEAMKDRGDWWCHLEGCQKAGDKGYNDEDEFWIGFCEQDNSIDFHFYSYEGMCGYNFKHFYDADEIDNGFDMWIQVNTINWLNKMIDDGILALGDREAGMEKTDTQ